MILGQTHPAYFTIQEPVTEDRFETLWLNDTF